MNLKCLFGHKWVMVKQYLAPRVYNPSPMSFEKTDLVSCLLFRCETCYKLKEKKLKGIVDIPEHAMRE